MHHDGDLRASLAAFTLDLEARMARGEDGLALGSARAAGLDRLLGLHYELPVAMAAVGSYGRGALALHSDIDLRFVQQQGASDADLAAVARAVMYPIWDAGLTVGHQIIHADDLVPLARRDLATATSLLDLRHVAGPDAPVRELLARAQDEIFGDARSFVARLEQEAAARHERFGGSVYLLEPDVKVGEGGLRDVDVLRWSGRVLEGDWLDEQELTALREAEAFLWRVRNRLHATQGRRTDRLTFDAQEAVALALGYDGPRALAAERMMQDYYVHARTISRLVTRAFERTRFPEPAGPQEVDPALALRIYADAVRRGDPVPGPTREAITRALRDPDACARLRESDEARALFVELVCTSREVPLARASPIHEMADAGILHAMIPEFLPVTGRVHHDVYHVHTVDVHSVDAVDCLRALVRGDLQDVHPLPSRLAAEIARPAPLFLATLLHDIGKGTGSRKHHSEQGAELCDVVLPRLGLPEEDVADARALVLHHLAMYHLATRRDLSDPATSAELARIVRGREGLRDLYLLTIADISTTAPNAMTSWKALMLQELYLVTDARLAGSPDDERLARLLSAARKAWTGDATDLDAFVMSMPARYRLATAPQAIAAHARLALEAGREPRVCLVPSVGEHLEICVVAPDHPGLLAQIAAALTANRLEVLAAQVYTREALPGPQAVDVFCVRGELGRLEGDVVDLCAGKVSSRDLILQRTGSPSPWRERPSPAVPSKVVFDELASPHATVIEVFAKDQPGLLFRLAQAITDLGLSIVLSKINTEGTKVVDVFYVHDSATRGRIEGAARFEQIRSRLLEAVSE